MKNKYFYLSQKTKQLITNQKFEFNCTTNSEFFRRATEHFVSLFYFHPVDTLQELVDFDKTSKDKKDKYNIIQISSLFDDLLLFIREKSNISITTILHFAIHKYFAECEIYEKKIDRIKTWFELGNLTTYPKVSPKDHIGRIKEVLYIDGQRIEVLN